jgi:tRNA G18 (ribose-2'-O)-methylase SpoU
MDQVRERIRTLNDELRRNLINGHAVITAGIAALGPEAVARIIKTIAVYDDFCRASDSYEEHDFGAFEADGQVILFKIDYYDKALVYHELRRSKIARNEFLTRPRRPITVVLDGVIQNYNIGAIFRLCDAFLVQQLVICGPARPPGGRFRNNQSADDAPRHWRISRPTHRDRVSHARPFGSDCSNRSSFPPDHACATAPRSDG